MTLDHLYPFWGQAHEDLLEVVSLLTMEQIEARPTPGAASIRDVLVRFLLEERFWVSHLVGGNDYEVPRPGQFPTVRSLVDALIAARDVTAHVLAPFSSEGLRAVRRVPADAQTNRLESNMPISLLIWHVVERELFAWGQVQLRVDDTR